MQVVSFFFFATCAMGLFWDMLCNGFNFMENVHWVKLFGNMCTGLNILEDGAVGSRFWNHVNCVELFGNSTMCLTFREI